MALSDIGGGLATARWRRSRRSGPGSEQGVEVAYVDGQVAVRDAKHPTCRSC